MRDLSYCGDGGGMLRVNTLPPPPPPQITIQLRRFAQQIAIAMANRPPTERPYGSTARRTGGAVPDLDAILGSSSGESAEVDTSVGGGWVRVWERVSVRGWVFDRCKSMSSCWGPVGWALGPVEQGRRRWWQ